MIIQTGVSRSDRVLLVQESGAKRQRHEAGAMADRAATAQGTGEAPPADGEAAPPAFASAGVQDVNTIMGIGDATMPPVQDAPAVEVSRSFLLRLQIHQARPAGINMHQDSLWYFLHIPESSVKCRRT